MPHGLTVGVGIETSPVFSPDGSTIAFTGGVRRQHRCVSRFRLQVVCLHRVTYHPSVDTAVGWSPDGKQILFRSDRQANSRYTQLYEVPAAGGFAKAFAAADGVRGTDLERRRGHSVLSAGTFVPVLTTTGMLRGEIIAAAVPARSGSQG